MRDGRLPAAAGVLTGGLVLAILGVLAVAVFHRGHGDIARPGFGQGIRPGVLLGALCAVPASFALALRPRSVAVWTAAVALVVGAVVGSGVATQFAVAARAAAMPTTPPCTGGEPPEESDATSAARPHRLEADSAVLRAAFARVPSPGHFVDAEVSGSRCVGNLMDVPVADAYAF